MPRAEAYALLVLLRCLEWLVDLNSDGVDGKLVMVMSDCQNVIDSFHGNVCGAIASLLRDARDEFLAIRGRLVLQGRLAQVKTDSSDNVLRAGVISMLGNEVADCLVKRGRNMHVPDESCLDKLRIRDRTNLKKCKILFAIQSSIFVL